MRSNTFLSSLIAAGALMFFSNCNSGRETEKVSTVDTTASASKMEEAPVKPGNTLLVMHKISNYAKWKPIFDSDDSARKAHNLTKIAVGRGMDDSNMIFMAFRMPDTAQAKAFVSSPELKTKMGKAGVIGAPTITYFDVQTLDTASTNSLKTRVIMMHKVKDWDTWKKEFDSHKQARIDAGLVDRAVGYVMGDNHSVIVACGITDLAKAKAFFQSADLKEKMMKAGVEGQPKPFFYNVVE